ncbi:nitroreductase family deazaflavin-dependent oxidoreductase [Streptomyces canus]|uniref:nitroreductase family deazaflavin-dependent oxidoreductase n=1 Tax=Streptomyces canus TaxID=58343 RepID=UPI002256D65C|nr:nitroreductase family deazaflavin-dependent oxidoreductase [Streptomyces canus]MCX4854897.1 nitroreductase family deazaflavin-dependent oxidoreductase [Streptomyces canus]WSW39699.1 nitroreductase family deazaflavin-dependent oxidoreductase [Streptomyces canus]
MTQQQSTPHRPQPPTGWRRLAFRLPIRLYHAGLGPLLGKRFLLLHHTGRKSGRKRQVVLEVVSYDKHTDIWTIASGFGPKSDWYQNLRHRPQATIQFGRRHFAVTAHFLSPEEGADVMADYARRHPQAARRLSSLMGFPRDDSQAAFRKVGEAIPFVRLEGTPQPSSA